jgi:DNA-damage-inducible protein D
MKDLGKFRPGRSPFDIIVQQDEDGNEWWSAREFMSYLGYTEWRNLENVIKKARINCRNSGHDPDDHFVDVTKMVDIGFGTRRKASDVHMTRFGCYLLAANGDPTKYEIAAAKRYFVVMARVAELEVQSPPPGRLRHNG